MDHHGSPHLLLNSVCLEHTDHWSDYNTHSSVFSLIFKSSKNWDWFCRILCGIFFNRVACFSFCLSLFLHLNCEWRHHLLITKSTFFWSPGDSSVQLLTEQFNSSVAYWTPWTTAHQASLFITNSRSPPKPMSIESVMPSNHLVLCCPLLLLPSIFPSIRVYSNESALCIRWPKYWSFSFNISPSNEYPGLISFRMEWLDLLAVQDSQESFPTPQYKSINFSALSFLYSLTLTSIYDHWKNHSLN